MNPRSQTPHRKNNLRDQLRPPTQPPLPTPYLPGEAIAAAGGGHRPRGAPEGIAWRHAQNLELTTGNWELEGRVLP